MISFRHVAGLLAVVLAFGSNCGSADAQENSLHKIDIPLSVCLNLSMIRARNSLSRASTIIRGMASSLYLPKTSKRPTASLSLRTRKSFM
jgi:hypothetical protein